MTTPSFSHWANDLADHITKKSIAEKTHEPFVVAESLDDSAFINYLTRCTPEARPVILANAIVQAFTWDKSPQGQDFWQEVYRLLFTRASSSSVVGGSGGGFGSGGGGGGGGNAGGGGGGTP